MGCGQSKFEPEEKAEEVPASLRPVRRRVTRRNIGRRMVRSRKDSIVSTTDLLRSAADDISDVASDIGSRRLCPLKEEDLEKRVVGKVDEEEELEKRVVGKVDEEEEKEFPGSPSFRFYFHDPDPVADKCGVVEDVLGKPKIEEKSQENDDSFVSSDSSEGSVRKSPSQVKRTRLKSFKKGQNVVVSLLRAHGCYNHHHHSTLAHVTPRSSNENDA